MTDSDSNATTQSSRLQDSYDALYAEEATGIQALNLDGWPRNRWEALVHCMPEHAKNVLEIGCGNGVVLHHIADRCDALNGMEISPNRCETARKNLADIGKPVSIFHGNLEEGVDIPDGTYDVILWADVIEHVVDLFATMREISRLLAKDGTLITSTPNLAYIRYRLALLFGKFPGTAARDEGFAVRPGEMYDAGHLHYLTFGTIERLYRMNGIEPTHTEGFGKFGRVHNIWPSLTSGAALVVGKKQ